MIKDWRSEWDEGDFPFYFVQLSSFNELNGDSNQGSKWAELREAQAETKKILPNVEMCVTTDVGNAKDIHPKNKQDVGARLAAIALHKDYGKNVTFKGPSYQSFKVKENKIVLSFKNVDKGFMVKDADKLIYGFEIARDDQKFVAAKVEIKENQLMVYHPNIQNPKSVRYNWADDAGNGNIYNKNDFPMEPFRTDNWKLTTENESFTINLF